MTGNHFIAAILVGSVGLALGAVNSTAQTMTPETKKMLEALNLKPDILAGLDEDLAVPQAWIDGAKKEGVVRVRLTMTEQRFAKVAKVFKARYPDIDVSYTRGVGRARATGPLLAYKRGTFVTDVHSSFDALEDKYREADALIKMTHLKTYKNIPEKYNAREGYGVAYRIQHWCMAYNTKQVKKEDLPKTWEELLQNPRWRNGNIGMGANVNVWLGPLWGVKGTQWVNDYIDKLFNVVKPQLRKERLATLSKLASLGEFLLALPAGDFIVRRIEDPGASVSFHCPEPIPLTSAWIGIFKGNPHPNASNIFANWLLSKEGQIAVNYGDANIPAHKDLLRKEFLPYPEEVLGRKIVVHTAEAQANVPNVIREFRKHWLDRTGKSGPR